MRLQKAWQISKRLMALSFIGMGLAHLSGCSGPQIKVTDQLWYADAGTSGAVEFHTLTDAEVDYDFNAWAVKRFGMVCTTTDTFATNKANLEKLCSWYNACSYPEVQQLLSFFDRGVRIGNSLKQFSPHDRDILTRLKTDNHAVTLH